MLFKDIPGLQALKSSLIHTIKTGRVSHAQLFLGKQGTGALPLAIAYSRYLMCQNQKDDDSCGACPSCKKIDTLAHPDLHFSYPIKLGAKTSTSDDALNVWREQLIEQPFFGINTWNTKLAGANKQSVIAVKESENIVKKLSLKSYEAGYKILIQWLPESMNATAANKLLKIIEEPPKNTLFLLISQHHEGIISTILSRTQIVKVPSYSESEIEQYMATKFGLEPSVAHDIAHLADRDLSKAIELSKNHETTDHNIDNFIQWMRICYQRKAAEAVDWVDTIAKIGREQQKDFLYFCLHLFRQCIVGHYVKNELVILTQAQEKFLQKFAPFINYKNIIPLSEAFEKAHYHIERNANPKILFLDLSLKVFAQLKKTT